MTVNEKTSQVVTNTKVDGEQMEYANYDGPEMPASLKALSPEEFAKVGRKATFKMDIIVMPVLVTMYILNYLDRQVSLPCLAIPPSLLTPFPRILPLRSSLASKTTSA